MKAPKKPRAKSAAAVAVPQSREDVINDIRKIGDITRVILRRETELNDKLAELTNDAAPGIEALKKDFATIRTGKRSRKSWAAYKLASRRGVKPTVQSLRKTVRPRRPT